METAEIHITHLRAAEAQIRLATAARLAVTLGYQPLDLPVQWSHGKHSVSYSEIALSTDEADFAAWNLQRSTTFLMASAALEAIRATISNPRSYSDRSVVSAYQIARMIRNAFAHSPFNPIWSIDPDCLGKRFEVPDVIHLDCADLNGKPFDWRHYGGPLAILTLSRFVRYHLLGDTKQPEKVIPLPEQVYYQQGDLILMKIDDVPPGAVPVEVEKLSGGGIPLGGGHVLTPADKE